MSEPSLKLINPVHVPDATLLLALGGWMDGGFVSTGTVRHLMQSRNLVEIARIDPAGFYIDNFPGSMELAALLRPHVRYKDGLIEEIEFHSNEIQADVENKLVFFVGKEPNLNWARFADCLFEVVRAVGVGRIIFMGSFGGSVPHTREPRLYGSVSERKLLPLLQQFGLKPTDYEGPASFAGYLLNRAPANGVEMVSISCEIPGYLEGANPLSIAAVARRLSSMLNIPVDLDELLKSSSDWESQVSDAIVKDKSLAKKIRKMEEQYDRELVDLLGIEES